MGSQSESAACHPDRSWNALPVSRLATSESLEQLRALEAGWRPEDTISNLPIEEGSYRPKNARERYSDEITLEDAFASSSNVAAVRLMGEVGSERVIRMARSLGVRSDMPEGDPEEDALSEALQAAMAEYHPSEPHWYLWTLGADPSVQGQGYGALLLEHRLAQIDERSEPAYLEASSPGLVPFYQRFGFEQIGLIDVDPIPPLTPMFRRAR